MMQHAPEVLTRDQVRQMRAALEAAEWVNGRESVGGQGATVKKNRQLPDASPVRAELSAVILQALTRHPIFFSAALPLRYVPPYFNRYEGGETYGLHVDGPVRMVAGGPPVRTDLCSSAFRKAEPTHPLSEAAAFQ